MVGSASTESNRTFRPYEKEGELRAGCGGFFDLSTSDRSQIPKSTRADATRKTNEIAYGSFALIMQMFVEIDTTHTKKDRPLNRTPTYDIHALDYN